MPIKIAGSDRTGIANRVAMLISDAAVSPVPIRVPSIPPPTSSSRVSGRRATTRGNASSSSGKPSHAKKEPMKPST